MDSADKSFKKNKNAISNSQKLPANDLNVSGKKIKAKPTRKKKPDAPTPAPATPNSKKPPKKSSKRDENNNLDRSSKRERKRTSDKLNGSQKNKAIKPAKAIQSKKPEKEHHHHHHRNRHNNGSSNGSRKIEQIAAPEKDKDKENNNVFKESEEEESAKGGAGGGGPPSKTSAAGGGGPPSKTSGAGGGGGPPSKTKGPPSKTKRRGEKDNGEIKLVKEDVAVLKNSATARDENEMSDVEAEQPKSKPDKTIVKRGGRLEIGDSIFEIIDGSVLGDYGNCTIREIGKDELLTFRYESVSSKCKRIKIECTVLVCAAATQKTHMLRLLLRGSIDNFKLRYLITDALGYSIPDLLTQISIDCFPISSALRLAYETFESLEELHKINFIHRDIKPAAYAFGLKPLNTKIFLTHFGLAKKFRGSADAKLLAPRKTVPFMGTVKYASRTVHERGERSRKDDIESWVYMISEFVDEKALSWRKIVNRDEILKEKCLFMSDEGISHLYLKHKKIPEEFRPLIHYVMSLEFSSSPDYLYIKKILREAMEKRNVSQNDPWEWEGLEDAIEDGPKNKHKNDTLDTTQQNQEESQK